MGVMVPRVQHSQPISLVGSPAPVLTFISAPSPTTFTHNPSIGADAASRIVIVVASFAHNTGNIAGININGNPASTVGAGIVDDPTVNSFNIYYASVPTGSTCTIEVTNSIGSGGSANLAHANLAIYTLTGCKLAPSDTVVVSVDVTFAAMTVSGLDVLTNGVGAVGILTDRPITCTWSGGGNTVDAHQVGGGAVDRDLFALSTRTAGSLTFTSVGNAATYYGAVAAAWEPL